MTLLKTAIDLKHELSRDDTSSSPSSPSTSEPDSANYVSLPEASGPNEDRVFQRRPDFWAIHPVRASFRVLRKGTVPILSSSGKLSLPIPLHL